MVTMINAVYQATVSELETVLSARVVSRSLNEGLKQVGKTPDSVDVADMETILKSHIYRQLQVAMPVEQAKEKITGILEQLSAMAGEAPSDEAGNAMLEQQQRGIDDLQEAMRPFNLYFEWSEMQKLRAQIQLIETEHEGGREASQLINSARSQLELVKQKLEDQLVAQAEELGRLEEALRAVKSVGGSKVRRLGRLVKQVQESQENRQLASAEIERARKIANDLRQSVPAPAAASEEEAPPAPAAPPVAADDAPIDDIPVADVLLTDMPPVAESEGDIDDGLFDGLLLDLDDDDEATEEALLLDTSDLTSGAVSEEQIQQLKLEEEGYELNALAQNYAELGKYMPNLLEDIEAARASLAEQVSLGGHLAELRQELESAKVNLIATLKHDLEFKQSSLADFDDDLEYQDLQQNIAIAQGVLRNDTLPPENDIRQIRDRYRLLEQQANELRAQRAEQAAQFRKRLEGQAETIADLQQTFARYEASLNAEAYGNLQQALERLERAQSEGRLESDTLSQAREAAQELENSAAEHAEGREKEQANIRALMAQVRNLPALSQLEHQQKQLLSRLAEHLQQSQVDELVASDLQASEQMLANLKEDVNTVYRHRIRDMRAKATELESRDALQQLDSAENSIQEASYPNLDIIEQELSRAATAKLGEQLNELYQLEEERRQIANISDDDEDAKLFAETLQEAHAKLEAGQLVDNIGHAWSLLEAMRQASKSKLTSFEPRLDKALADFEPISKLNTDDSINVSRILRHLDSQRASFQKVSASMQANLEEMLVKAESMMTPLKNEFEATRDIAGMLVSGNVLDDMLNLFGSPDDTANEPAEAEPQQPERTLTEVRSGNQVLNEWVDDYLEERGIRGAIVFNSQGDVLAGRTLLEPEPLFTNVRLLENDWRHLGKELDVGVPELLTIEVEENIMIIAFPSSHDCIVILLEMPSMLNLILNKLRRDIPAISDLLTGPAFA